MGQAAERCLLHFLHEREATNLFTLNLELDQNVFAGSVTEHQGDVALQDLQRFRLVLAAVNDRRYRALCLDLAHCGPSRAGAPGGREFYLFRHGFSFLVRTVVDLEERGNRLVIVNPLNAVPEQLRDTKHRGDKSFHGANRHAVGRY